MVHQHRVLRKASIDGATFPRAERHPRGLGCAIALEWLKREEKVSLAISMTDACVLVCADSIRDLYPGIGGSFWRS
ncbi:MAG: hypothetical protein QXQ76_04755 [Candidatus Bathyarchaeia archaeon]